MVRVTVGVEAHTHEFIATAHEDQKFGLSIADGTAAAVIAQVLAQPSLDLIGLHTHIGSQIFDTSGFEVSARRAIALHAAVCEAHGIVAARARPRRRLRHPLHEPGRSRSLPSSSRPR